MPKNREPPRSEADPRESHGAALNTASQCSFEADRSIVLIFLLMKL